VNYQPLIIQQVHEEVKGFKTFVFEEGHNILYHAGQYLTFIYKTETEEIRRSYSITSAPLLQEPLAIGVKRIPNGAFSRLLVDRSQPGDMLWTTGAGGFFTLPEDISHYSRMVFLAAGSGITPIFSLIKTVLHLHPHIQVMLIYSSPSLEQTIFYPALQQLHATFPHQFECRYLFSNAPELRHARLNRDLLIELVQVFTRNMFHEALYYVCGPESYMRFCMYTLQEQKVPPEQIRRENFIIEKTKPPRPLPPDRETRHVTIHYGSATFEFNVKYPESILANAKKNHISLPYSCETGRCGNCVAR
jgi:ring-1,2-phenylacetyl-CoA epoxidase subunit PaaE